MARIKPMKVIIEPSEVSEEEAARSMARILTILAAGKARMQREGPKRSAQNLLELTTELSDLFEQDYAATDIEASEEEEAVSEPPTTLKSPMVSEDSAPNKSPRHPRKQQGRHKPMRVIAVPAEATQAQVAKRHAKLYLLLKSIEERSEGKSSTGDIEDNTHLEEIEEAVKREIAAQATSEPPNEHESPKASADSKPVRVRRSPNAAKTKRPTTVESPIEPTTDSWALDWSQ